jgi:hypothetical protein
MVHPVGHLMRCIKIPPRRLPECDAFQSLAAQAVVLDRIGELQRVFIVGHLGTFFGDEYQEPVASEWVIDRIRKLGCQIDIFFSKVKRDDREHSLGVSVDARDTFGKIRRAGKQIGFGGLPRYEVFRHRFQFWGTK